jgi:hypothetical protein
VSYLAIRAPEDSGCRASGLDTKVFENIDELADYFVLSGMDYAFVFVALDHPGDWWEDFLASSGSHGSTSGPDEWRAAVRRAVERENVRHAVRNKERAARTEEEERATLSRLQAKYGNKELP